MGYKGNFLSNIGIMKEFNNIKGGKPWLGILEDDAILPQNLTKEIQRIRESRPDAKVIYFDKAHHHCTADWDAFKCSANGEKPGCCMAFTMWHRDIIGNVLQEVDHQNPKSVINNWEHYWQKGPCLDDWLFGRVLYKLGIPTAVNGVVASGSSKPYDMFKSETALLLSSVSREP